MTLDIRGLTYVDAFKQVKDAVSLFHTHDEDIIVFVDMEAARNIFQALSGKRSQGAVNNLHIVEVVNCV